jgi:hypothetical protein
LALEIAADELKPLQRLVLVIVDRELALCELPVPGLEQFTWATAFRLDGALLLPGRAFEFHATGRFIGRR